MGFKKNAAFKFNWSSSVNANPVNPNTPLSGTTTGAMASTNTIYSNTQDLYNFDNAGLIVSWTGTPVGTITVWVANLADDAFQSLTFDPALAQPAGSASGYAINLNQLPFRYVYIKYVNASGSGSLHASICQKDLN